MKDFNFRQLDIDDGFKNILASFSTEKKAEILEEVCGHYEGWDSSGRDMYLEISFEDEKFWYAYGMVGFPASEKRGDISLDEILLKLWTATANDFEKTSDFIGNKNPLKEWLV